MKVKRGRQKGDGKKNVRKCHDKSVPFPSSPILSEAPSGPSHSCLLKYRKEGNWLGRSGALRTKPMGVRGTLCHDIFCPIPFPASPSDLHRRKAKSTGENSKYPVETDGVPELQISVPCRDQACPDNRAVCPKHPEQRSERGYRGLSEERNMN